MRIHCLTHVPFEDAANIGTWAHDRGYSLTYTRFFQDGILPSLDSFDILAVMGGLMNIYEHDEYPWLITEKEYLKRAIDANKKIVGICLGGQLLSDVLGGSVVANQYKEIGWHTLKLTEAGKESDLVGWLPEEFTVFQWHGDTFTTPKGVINLAVTEACENQAFLYDGRVLGLQFHLEYMDESIKKMLKFCAHELVDGPFVNKKEEILAGFDNIGKTKKFLYHILDSLAAA